MTDASDDPRRLPMFPLGTVLFPSMLLPLHIFEPRYRKLLADCTEGDGEFGVVLIERGSEVGGGDDRTDVGTVARILEVRDSPDGRAFVMAGGVRRLRVVRWLPDDPYPVAEVADHPDTDPTTRPSGDRLESLVGLCRQVMARRSELGEPTGPATVEFADDPELATFQIAAVSGLTTADQHALLAEPTTMGRVDRLHELLLEELDFLTRRLALD